VPVAIVKDDDPDDAPTGAADVCSADTIVALVATAETDVPAATVATKRSASAASIVLSAGTGNVAGVAITPLVVFATESSVTATVITVAFAGATATMPKVMAATTASAIFLNEFITYFSLFIVFLVHPNSLGYLLFG
jgi:hypothetical protein